jgi:SAM-dependent methyltransferase
VKPLFDMELRALRRDRSARIGPELFLLDRAFEDCLERLALIPRRFAQALLVGCPSPRWPERLRDLADDVAVTDPGPLFAARAGGEAIVEDRWGGEPSAFDLIIAVGTLDTVNDLPRALLALRLALRPGGLLLAAMSGGETLPQLRGAMRAADKAQGDAAAHVHPRIEASALAGLLGAAGFADPVVDVDRVGVTYGSFERLVSDLRAMASTSLLTERPRRPISRSARQAAIEAFAAAATDGRTTEVFEILHGAAWAPEQARSADQG